MAEEALLDSLSDQKNLNDMMDSEDMIKTESDVVVKVEPLECLVCASRSYECFDAFTTSTAASGVTLLTFLVKFTQVNIDYNQSFSRYVCKTCHDLINVLEQAEVEYLKLKDTFVSIISKNPMFENLPQPVPLGSVKHESSGAGAEEGDSEDEPLARTKRKQTSRANKKKKKLISSSKVKHKSEEKQRWGCEECGEALHSALELAAHKLAAHTTTDITSIKVEDSTEVDKSQSSFENGAENGISDTFGDFDDDDDSNFNPDELLTEMKSKKNKERRKRAIVKELLSCDQCPMQYTSQVRLEQHKQKKHDGSKPPYICEVCGAHYKHKRACDIHIQLHKGISDWKCEECNKLFPSKNALQRHNNIHTGKLNYQCDLCGKSFIHTSSFKMHKLSHSGEKPHACDVCGLALMTRSHLKRHKRVHSGEKRHECTLCGKRFSERYNLLAHARSHEPAGGAAPVREDATRRRLFRCHFCAERFERRYMLERHAAAAHGRALERPPPTPRNTMSKLLKAQAQARRDPPPPPPKLLQQLAAPPAPWPATYAPDFPATH